jgi:hypothetical protein
MSNALFAFCEDSFSGLGVVVVIVVVTHPVSQGKISSYIYSPTLQTIVKSPSMDSEVLGYVIVIVDEPEETCTV